MFFHLQLKSVFYSIDIVIYEPQRRIIFAFPPPFYYNNNQSRQINLQTHYNIL